MYMYVLQCIKCLKDLLKCESSFNFLKKCCPFQASKRYLRHLCQLQLVLLLGLNKTTEHADTPNNEQRNCFDHSARAIGNDG